MNYYNEIDPYCLQWLENQMEDGVIPKGIIDGRSITQVQPSDLKGFTQCHFFAGWGGWVHALHLARISPRTRLWTGSCPCPPFSVAGQKKKCPACGGDPIPCPVRTGYFICLGCEHPWFTDARHLWPEFHRLIHVCQPPVIFGEQVAGQDGQVWLTGVHLGLELSGYALGSADLCAAGVGAPHIRQRLYWGARYRGMADSQGGGRRNGQRRTEQSPGWSGVAGGGNDGGMAYTHGRESGDRHPEPSGEYRQFPADDGIIDGMADSLSTGRAQWGTEPGNGPSAGSRTDGRSGTAGRVEHSQRPERGPDTANGPINREGQTPHGKTDSGGPGPTGTAGRMGHSTGDDKRNAPQSTGHGEGIPPRGPVSGSNRVGDSYSQGSHAATHQGICGGEKGIGTWDGEFIGSSIPNPVDRLPYPIGPGLPVSQQSQLSRPPTVKQPRRPVAKPRNTRLWDDYITVPCLDGKLRRVGRGIRVLANGHPGRIGQLRALGNSLCLLTAAEFVQAFMEAVEAADVVDVVETEMETDK